jgi:hypothetical protein
MLCKLTTAPNLSTIGLLGLSCAVSPPMIANGTQSVIAQEIPTQAVNRVAPTQPIGRNVHVMQIAKRICAIIHAWARRDTVMVSGLKVLELE